MSLTAGFFEQSPPSLALDEEMKRGGITPDQCVAAVTEAGDGRSTQARIFDWKIRFARHAADDTLERLVLFYAILHNEARVDALPVTSSVKALFRKLFSYYLKPPASSKPFLLAGTDPFVTACKISTLRRFPAGPMDWVVSGIPRSWFAKMPPLAVPKVLSYLVREFGGLKPAFYIHIAPAPRNRSLVLKQEVKRAYYRMACCLELQPEMKGILCAAWFHDPAALRDAPHVEPLNEPYLHWGGRIVTSVGPASPDSGMLDYNPERRKQFETGSLKINATLAAWPRKAAIDWAHNNRDLEA
jgi:hypothetical protein